jgi:hypothetical protein
VSSRCGLTDLDRVSSSAAASKSCICSTPAIIESAGDHLVATRREEGSSQLERMLIAIGGFLALAYGATQFLTSTVESLPFSEPLFIGGAVVLGATVAFITRGQAARDRRVTVSVDGQGRPFLAEQRKDF